MSFFAPDFLKVIDPEELDRQLRGEFRPDELIVADGQFSVAPGLKLAEIGQVSRPAAIHFMPPAVVKVFRVERAGQ